MRWAAISLTLLLATQAAHAQAVDWHKSAGFGDDTLYVCNETCPTAKTVCAHFVQAGAKGLRLSDIANENEAPWGQIDFAVAAGVLRDRLDLAAEDVSTGGREDGPHQVSFAGLDWIRATYQIEAAHAGVEAVLLLWPDKSELHGLRCSFVAGQDVAEAIEGLAASLR